MSNEQTAPALAGQVDRQVRALADAFAEDYNGRELDAGSVARALAFVAATRGPDAVSAGEEGGIYMNWRAANESLSVHFQVNGPTVWAGNREGKRPYGAGEPLADDWCCLRSNDQHERASPVPGASPLDAAG